MTESVQINGHQIELFISIWNGKETIKYDGNVVCDRRNLRTFSSVNSFKVQEEGGEVVYEVQSIAGDFCQVMLFVEMELFRLISLDFRIY